MKLGGLDISRGTDAGNRRPSPDHLPVDRWVSPEAFDAWAERARELGFDDAAAGPLVRSSYHADEQHEAAIEELLAAR